MEWRLIYLSSFSSSFLLYPLPLSSMEFHRCRGAGAPNPLQIRLALFKTNTNIYQYNIRVLWQNTTIIHLECIFATFCVLTSTCIHESLWICTWRHGGRRGRRWCTHVHGDRIVAVWEERGWDVEAWTMGLITKKYKCFFFQKVLAHDNDGN